MSVGLEQIVQNKPLALTFRRFLYERYNNENFSFWLEAENYRSVASEELLLRRSREIFDKYFNAESKYELNIDHIQKRELESKISTPTTDLFLPIQGTIRKLMEMEAIPLFLKTDSYKKFKGNY
eukprot:gene8177-9613_t